MRYGRQTPTASVVLPYENTYGQDAIDLYNATPKTAQEWQENLLKHILAYNDEGLWVHTKFGYSVPRRNGKNEVVAMVELFALLKLGVKVLHTAHRTTTGHTAWERLCGFFDALDVAYDCTKQLGLETITLEGGGKIAFRTRSSKGGLGEGYDILVIDEAQEYTDDQESALKYVVSDSPNPLTIFCGTPPTNVSAGTVFLKFREKVLYGESVNSGWAEWGVEEMSDVHDVDLWYECNPSMGTILNERKVQDEITNDDIDFNIQRLGLWLKYNQKSSISEGVWDDLKVDKVSVVGGVFVGIKYSHEGDSVAMSVAAKTEDGKIFVEGLDCRPVSEGNGWILSALSKLHTGKNAVYVDGASGQQLLADDMKANKMKPPVLPTVKQFIVANSAFEQAIFQKTLVHSSQPSMKQIVTNCEKRKIGSGGGFGYKSILEGADVALMDSAILAHYSCSVARPPKKQHIGY